MRIPVMTPHWFTAVMGTGIVGIAAHTLPVSSPVLHDLSVAAWVLDIAVGVTIVTLTVAHYVTDPRAVRRYLLDPTSAPFYGAMSMGILTMGTSTLLIGSEFLGLRAAADIDLTLWWIGTLIGLGSAAIVPVLAFTRHRVAADAATPVWLLPVVAPMVSAAGGALLLDHVHGTAAQALAIACYAQFGATLMAAVAITGSVWNRLAHHQHRDPAAAPALLIVLGPLGQSVTAAGLLADHAPESLGLTRHAMTVFSILFGIPVMGFALLWLAIAAAIVIDTARRGLPFTLGWWSFTFPIGTCVTGATVLAHHTGAAVLTALAVALYALLLLGWTLAAGGTIRMLATKAADARRSVSASLVAG